jgi:predicted nucleotidyltransferase
MLPDARVLLFGSMARGDSNKDSDYDVLIIIPETKPMREKYNWKSKIRKALVYALDAPVDVLLNSEEEVKMKSTIFGHIVRDAVSEGIEI